MNRLNLLAPFAMALAIGIGSARAETIDYNNLDWSVQYLIDQSQTVLGTNQFNQPRNNRGLALSPDGRYLYAGYNNPGSTFEVRKIDTLEPDYNDATLAHLVGVSRGKAIATDDQGRVYMADAAAIKIYDANLTSLQHTIVSTNTEGVAVVRQGSNLVLFRSDRNTGMLSKFVLSESGPSVTGSSLDTSFNGTGNLSLSTNLRGVEVDPLTGNIWVADIDSNVVDVVSPAGALLGTVSVNSPIDVAFDGGTALVTRSLDMLISRFDTTTHGSNGSDLAAPLASLLLTSTPATGGPGALEGIVTVNGGFYVAGDGINTANGRSTYGRIDAESGFIGPDFYTDTTHDDNDTILFAYAPVPEPSSLALGCAALVGLAASWRRLRKRRA
jgi:DNA-binding beta-propeller fold protein YncE